MGREFFYCSRCQTRLSTEDLRIGMAIRVWDQMACGRCLPDVLAPLSLKEQEEILMQVRTLREGGRPAAARPAPPSSLPRISAGSTSTRLRAVGPVRAPGSGARTAAALVFVGAVVLLGVLAALHFLNEPPRPTELPASASPPALPPPAAAPVEVRVYRPPAAGREPTRAPAPAASPRDQAARAALEKARQAAQAVPADPAGALELYRKALLETVGTPLYAEAQKEIEELRSKVKEIVAGELEALDREVRAACEKEEFGRAIQILEKARSKYPTGEWTQGVDLRLRDVTVKHAWPAFLPLRDRALDARRRGAEDELRALKERVARWGLPSFATELEKTLAAAVENPAAATPTPAPPPELKPPSEEARLYQKFWQEAALLAAAREYDAAVTALERAAERVREPDVATEARTDLEFLRGAAATWREALEALLRWPPGERLPLEHYDELGSPRKIEAPLVRADAQEVEVMQGGAAVPVDLGEVTAHSLAEILARLAGSRPAASPRALALFCLLDGDVEAARRFLGGPSDQIPWKYWALGARVAEERANPASEAGRREIAARRLYFAAEIERRAPRTRGAAIEKYRALLNDYADTAIVRRRRVHIAAQREAGREYVFLAGDLAAAGTFKPARAPKLGPCWTSEAESNPQQGRENTIDFSFYALPDASYRCWVHVGGCCQETFTFYYQTTDLTVPHPQTREILSVDPGGNVSVPVRVGIPFLKPRHEMHGGPKEPKRWEWVAIPLPRYPSAGLKTVRLLTEEKGFSVAAAVVSASRTQPPVESELRAWLRAAQPESSGAEEPAADASPRDPALVGHWKFDETGPTAVDASGNDNTGILVNEPRRAPGRIGGALVLDGRDRYVNIPDSPTLRKLQEGDYTIAAWFRPNSRPPGADAAAHDGSYAIVMKAGRPEGLKYGPDQRFSMDHWFADGTGVGVSSAGAYPPGTWYHVAGVVSRAEGTIRIYVNGKADGAVPFPAAATPFDFAAETWKIGIAAPGAATHRWAADGAVDDVRLYARALGPNDVRILAGSAAGGPIAVEITSPAPGERLEAGVTLAVSASVANGEGRVAKVEFYNGSHLLGMDATFPYVLSWNKVPSGVYTLTARAVDKSGAVYVSPPVTIRVGNASLYRAIDLAGQAAKFDGLDWEGPQARSLSVKGEAAEPPEVALDPPVADPRWASLLRTSVTSKEGTHVALNPMPNGSYQVYLYVWNPRGPQSYEILLKGRVVGRYAGGPAGRWDKLGPWFVDVTDGALDVAARGGEAHFSALEVWRVTR